MKHHITRLASISAAAIFCTAALTGCGGGGGGSSSAGVVGGDAVAAARAIVGVAATGAALPDGAVVTVLSSDGLQNTVTLGNGDGSFSIQPRGVGPYLVYVDHGGKRMYGYAETDGVRANLTQLTDAIVRAALPVNYMDDAETAGQELRASQPPLEVGQGGGLVMKGRFNRRLYDCVPEGGDPDQRRAWLNGTYEMDSTFYANCLAKFDSYVRKLQFEIVNLRWDEFSGPMAANMAAATSKVINALGADNVRQITAAIGQGNEVDLSAINPLSHQFEANRTKFDALLDRLKIERVCDNSSAACTTTFALYEDAEQQVVSKVSKQVYRFRDNFINNDGVPAACSPIGLPIFDKPTAGQWAQIISMRTRDQDIDSSPEARAGAEFVNNQSACSVLLDADFVPVATTQASASASLTCANFPVGQPSLAPLRVRQFGIPAALEFSEQGGVVSCAEFTNPDNIEDREITITFDFGNPGEPENFRQYNVRYLRVPGN